MCTARAVNLPVKMQRSAHAHITVITIESGWIPLETSAKIRTLNLIKNTLCIWCFETHLSSEGIADENYDACLKVLPGLDNISMICIILNCIGFMCSMVVLILHWFHYPLVCLCSCHWGSLGITTTSSMTLSLVSPHGRRSFITFMRAHWFHCQLNLSIGM